MNTLQKGAPSYIKNTLIHQVAIPKKTSRASTPRPYPGKKRRPSPLWRQVNYVNIKLEEEEDASKNDFPGLQRKGEKRRARHSTARSLTPNAASKILTS